MLASRLLLVRPRRFGYDEASSLTNVFQSNTSFDPEEVMMEFDAVHTNLRSHGFEAIVLEDHSNSPDAIFPNNWFCCLPEMTIVFPMHAPHRRTEINEHSLKALYELTDHRPLIDLRTEIHGESLEGTGSLVLDGENKVAFMGISERSSFEIANRLCESREYDLIAFETNYEGMPVYHTNVMMSNGLSSLIVCKDVITNGWEQIEAYLDKTNKSLLQLSREQIAEFAGNILLVQNKAGKNYWIMSRRAHKSFSPEQKAMLEKDGEILSFPIPTIEEVGGGSLRCMVAEMF